MPCLAPAFTITGFTHIVLFSSLLRCPRLKCVLGLACVPPLYLPLAEPFLHVVAILYTKRKVVCLFSAFFVEKFRRFNICCRNPVMGSKIFDCASQQSAMRLVDGEVGISSIRSSPSSSHGASRVISGMVTSINRDATA